MLVFDARDWNAAKGQTAILTGSRKEIELHVSCTKEVRLLGVSEGKKIPLHSGTTFRVRAKAEGFDSLILVGTGQTEYGYSLRDIARQDGEPIDHENPPAAPMPGQDNLLLAMRRIMQEEMRRNRAPVMDPEDLPWSTRYEVDEDDFEFEEEMHSRSQQQQQTEPGTTPPAGAVEPASPGDASASPQEPREPLAQPPLAAE